MSGLCARHLERRQGIFGLRVRIPDDIRPLVGMVEVRRSLRTYDPFRARIQSAVYAARLFEVFAMVRDNQAGLAPDDVKAMIAACFREMVLDAVNFTSPGARQASFPQAADGAIGRPKGPTLAEAVGIYLGAKKASWTAKTFESRRLRLGYLNEHMGEDTSLSAITTADVRSFRDAVGRLRRHQGRSRPMTFAAKQTEIAADRIDPKTAILIFEPIKAFFRWCKSEQGYLAANPAEDVRISLPKRVKGRKSRRPFTAEDLTQLFSSPVFTGCLSRSRRFDPGDQVIRDAKFWLPILGYYTGARLGELVQLHLADIETDGAIPHLSITEEVAGVVGATETKHVKSSAGVRCVPLHDDLIGLGFLAFVEERRRRQRRGSRRLFSEIEFGADGQASTVFSKWFGRLMDKVGLDDPALVFHSFRHNAEDALRDALQPQYVIDRIIGHSDGATSAGYGNGISLEVARDAVQAMKLKARLTTIVGLRRA